MGCFGETTVFRDGQRLATALKVSETGCLLEEDRYFFSVAVCVPFPMNARLQARLNINTGSSPLRLAAAANCKLLC